MSRWLFDRLSARTPTNYFALGLVTPAAEASTNTSALREMEAMLPRDQVWLSGWELLGGAIFSRVQANLWKVVAPMVVLVLASLYFAFRRSAEILLSLGVLLLSGLCLLTVMRLAGWSWNLLEAVVKAFHARHKEIYTFDLPFRGVEFLTFRLRATAPRSFGLQILPLAQGTNDPKGAFKRTRRCWFGKESVDTACYDGERMLAGHVLPGPAIVEEKATTVVVPKGFTATVDAAGTYLLRRS